ncbi:hypothetical protein ACTHP5_21345 [Bacillus subtilis]|uniref:Uncharacterized protein n=1 Tax=Bacillus subtilis TaxID=1423 RepID=A0A1J0AKS8_BACIU|nr:MULTISPECIES: hypothetical protein [Bacillus subtilis group]MCY7883540.1 hypothetical protein [Bacillus spizizenii]APB62354.1 hypothetical protein pBS72_0850 [Bacillus subtilis]MCY8057167.1 hypothetical protein [Bacillus inaquosorum]MCY8636126.1 hypothetical protein [Bacillus spizizenii]MCY9397858.1 hypothetical protein [Bacillus inaquosorum]
MDLTVNFSLYNTKFAMPEVKTLQIPVPDYIEDVSRYLNQLVINLKWEVISFEYTGIKLMRTNGEYELVNVKTR